jgi:hypothetical protein
VSQEKLKSHRTAITPCGWTLGNRRRTLASNDLTATLPATTTADEREPTQMLAAVTAIAIG